MPAQGSRRDRSRCRKGRIGPRSDRQRGLASRCTGADVISTRSKRVLAPIWSCRATVVGAGLAPSRPSDPFLRVRLRRRALLVFLTELDDPLLSESFARAMRLLSGQHAVVAGMLKPPGVAPLFTEGSVTSEDDVLERLGGHIAWRSLKELEISLRRQGVRFSLLVPDLVCQQLVGVYQEIKQRQII